MRYFKAFSVILAVALHSPAIQASELVKAEEFFAQRSDVLVGRDALSDARANIQTENTYTVYEKPSNNVVLVQDFDADTHDRLFSVALVDDANAEAYYEKYKDTSEEKRSDDEDLSARDSCRRGVDPDSAPLIFERASRCSQFCGRSRDCTGDARCPLCVYVGGNCRWQLRCRPR